MTLTGFFDPSDPAKKPLINLYGYLPSVARGAIRTFEIDTGADMSLLSYQDRLGLLPGTTSSRTRNQRGVLAVLPLTGWNQRSFWPTTGDRLKTGSPDRLRCTSRFPQLSRQGSLCLVATSSLLRGSSWTCPTTLSRWIRSPSPAPRRFPEVEPPRRTCRSGIHVDVGHPAGAPLTAPGMRPWLRSEFSANCSRKVLSATLEIAAGVTSDSRDCKRGRPSASP